METLRRVTLLAALLMVLTVGVGTAAAVPMAKADGYVKYYVVQSSNQGAPETLASIANRVLGGPERVNEIFTLNVNRVQFDGGKLTDPNSLNVGWVLVLPWDATGPGVTYGLLPVATPTPKPPSQARPGTGTGATPGKTTAAPPPPAASLSGCAGTAAKSTNGTQWAQLRMAPTKAWERTRGSGQIVAIVDSGVDASLPELTGHVATGADIVSGSARGDTDCLGTGTVMASLIVAQSGTGSQLAGIAPDAMVMPVRVATNSPTPRPDDVAAGINVAASTSASVIALGPVVDIRDRRVAEAIIQAVSHNIVVVAGALTGAALDPTSPAGQAERVLLKVGGVGIGGEPITTYRAGGVDVVAPGAEVTSLGIAGTGMQVGTGTHHAVAFTAAAVALVRAARPGLTAAQVINRIKSTSEPLGGGELPSSSFGWGMVSPGAAVTTDLPDEVVARGPAVGDAAEDGGGAAPAVRTIAILVVVIVALVAAALIVARVRKMVRPAPNDAEPKAIRGGSDATTAVARTDRAPDEEDSFYATTGPWVRESESDGAGVWRR